MQVVLLMLIIAPIHHPPSLPQDILGFIGVVTTGHCPKIKRVEVFVTLFIHLSSIRPSCRPKVMKTPGYLVKSLQVVVPKDM
jgi:hypothetical protein